MSKPEYRRTVRAARFFVEKLSGDFGCERPESNRLALESMVAGWMMGRPHFGRWMAATIRKYPRSLIIDEVWDQAIQAADDAAGDNPKFKESKLDASRIIWPDPKTLKGWKEAYAKLLRDYVSTRRQLNRIKKLAGLDAR